MRVQLTRFGRVLGQQRGWRRWLWAAGAGFAATLAMPPVHAIPLLWVSFPVLLCLIDTSEGPRSAVVVGWWFGFGHLSAGVYWIANAMLVDAARFAWAIPFGVFGLGAYLALFPAAAVWLTRRCAPRPGVMQVLTFSLAWTVMEWCRGWVLTGFPWNLIGSVWVAVTPILQAASVVGVYGLSALTVCCAAMPVLLLTGEVGRRAAAPVVVALLGLAAVAGLGYERLPAAPLPNQPGVRLRLVQGNIPETLKWAPGSAREHLALYTALSESPGFEGITAVIWPETALPYWVVESFGATTVAIDDATTLRSLLGAVPPGGLLLTGANHAVLTPASRQERVFNSLVAVDGAGAIVGDYDKVHLVPFGEYVPLGDLLPLAKLTPVGAGMRPGAGPTTLQLPGLPPVSPLICFDSIFSNAAAPAERPAWLLNITNDAWFGISAGPYQHLAAAQLRAVEQGLPLARVGYTGISAMIDPYGRVRGEIALGTQGILDTSLPLPLAPTLYSRVQKSILVTVVTLERLCTQFISAILSLIPYN